MQDIQNFAKLIKDIKFAMLTTVCAKTGSLQSRPMTLQQVEFDGDLWFFASKSSEFVKQIKKNPNVNLAFSNQKDFSFVSAQGQAEMFDSMSKKKELWNSLYTTWFPHGIEDPELCLLKVVIDSADYWTSPDSKLIRLVGFAKAMLGGKKEEALLGEHGHLTLH